MRARLAAECLGTFMLVFAGTGAIVVDGITGGAVGHVGVALVFGLVVMVAVYSYGEVSGAHINPAVSVAFWLAGRFPVKRLAPYVAAQCTGALLASGCIALLFPAATDLGTTIPRPGAVRAFGLEVVLGFMLMTVIIRTATGSRENGTMAGAAIGATVGLAALFAGPVTGASMNPARSLGPALMSGQLQFLWLYLTAPVVGMAAAVFVDHWMTGGTRRRGAAAAEAAR